MYFFTGPPPSLVQLFRRFTSAPKPAAHKFLTVVSAISAPPFQLFVINEMLPPSCQQLHATNTSRRK
jgi:hypothetical protein